MADTKKAKTEDQLPEVVDPKTGEVMDPAMLGDMMSDLQAGLGQTFTQDDLIIPRITILQDLSPQVKERKAEYVPGARPGLIYNSVNNALEDVLKFVPATYHAPWVAWKPRPDGGLVSNDVDPKILTPENGFQKDGVDRYVGMLAPQNDPNGDKVKVEIIKTPEWVGIARGDGWTMPVAISFPATKSKAARKINTSIDLCEIELPNGRTVVPPSFYHTFSLAAALESSGDNEWFGWSVTHEGYAGTDKRMLERARELRKSLADGTVTVAEHTEQA